MEMIKLIAIILGATGFWKLLEFLIKLWTDKKKQLAEIRNIQAQTESHIVDNWKQWAEALERRVHELETVAQENKELKNQIENQRKRICELEKKVGYVEKENEQLRNKLREISKT